MSGKIQCSKTVHSEYSIYGYRCSHSGSVQRDGRWYCKRHDPEAIAARDKARDEKWAAEWKASDIQDKYQLSIERARDRVIRAAKRWRHDSEIGAFEAALREAVNRLEKLEKASK